MDGMESTVKLSVNVQLTQKMGIFIFVFEGDLFAFVTLFVGENTDEVMKFSKIRDVCKKRINPSS